MGALYLTHTDDRFQQADGLFYARFMDDWEIPAPTR